MQPHSFTFKLDSEQQKRLVNLLRNSNVRPVTVPYTQIAVDADQCRIALYNSGKCVVQGKGAKDWVLFQLEPLILLDAQLGYREVHDPKAFEAHMGIDESGKGDFFGPLVIAAAYADEQLAHEFDKIGVRDSKTISSDKKAEAMARTLRSLLGHRFAIVTIGPRAYNRLYAKMKNVNAMLAWGHARAIENLLEKVPDCPRAVADQFGPKRQIEQALMKQGRSIELHQRPKAESDPAVAAASILARAGFLHSLQKLGESYGVKIPKGASPQVREVAGQIVESHGPKVLLDTAKCHFRTTDAVLEAANRSRSDLGPEGAAVSKAFTRKAG